MYKLQVPQQQPVDQEWYDRLRPLLQDLGETFEALMPPQQQLQHDYEEFRAHGKLPNLYPHLDNTGKYDKLRSDLEDLQKLYTWRIDESILNIDMILAAGRQDDKAFETANRKIYGEPNRTIFDSSCAWIREQIRIAVAQNKSIEKVGNELLGLLPDTRGDASELFPDPETFSKVRNLHLEPSGYLPQLMPLLARQSRTLGQILH
jgi:hypothetical protein